jgi:peptidoglycan/xylan/chitin deacetylase (PgdA/CDA1 family)
MSASTKLLRLTFETLHRFGVAAALRPWSQGLGVIFCMHSVQPDTTAADGFAPNAGLTSTPQFLDTALTMLRQAGYEFLSLDDALLRIKEGGGTKPFAVFTLDDGYRDNLVHALPVFEKHNCPFTVYVTPGFVEASTEMWWVALERIIAGNTGRIEAAGTAAELDGTSAAKWAAWAALSPAVQGMPEHEQRVWIRETCSRFELNLAALCQELIMSWNEVRKLAAHPLATIGAHTLNHFAVSRLSEDEARKEIALSGKALERELGRPVRHFAYPYGNVAHAGRRDFKLCAEAGYATAVTTRMGAVYRQHGQHLHALPRVMVSSKYAEPRWLKVLASGLPGRMSNLGGKLNVR